MPRTVILHPDNGIYVGEAMGMGFWSRLEAAGQDTVTSFADEADAKDYLAGWMGDHSDEIAACTFVEVDAEGPGVTVEELEAAGLGEYLGELVANSCAPGVH